MYKELVKRLREVEEMLKIAQFKEATNLINQAVDAIEELLKAAKSMHTWIFLNSGDEQDAYDECGLSDEMNAALGYCGAYEMRVEPPKEE